MTPTARVANAAGASILNPFPSVNPKKSRTNMPLKLASEVAALIQSDPVMSRQIKEHVSPTRLAELLEIDPIVIVGDEPAPEASRSLTDVLESYENGEVLEYITQAYTLAEILEAFRLVKRK